MKLPYKNSHEGIKILGQKWEEDNILGRYVVTEYAITNILWEAIFQLKPKIQSRTGWESNMCGLTTYPLPVFPYCMN